MDRISLDRVLTNHFGQSSSGLSPRVWSRIRNRGTGPDGSAGYFVGDDFLSFGLTTAVGSNVGRYASRAGAYLSYEDTGGSIAQLATEVGGVVRVTTDTTDNDECWMQPGGATSVIAKAASSSTKLVVFESRVRVSQVASGNYFVGLSEEGLAAADTVTDAGALASKDLLGFWILEGAPTSLIFGYRKAGQAAQTVFTYGTAIAASTWYKVGFVLDPEAPPSQCLKAFVDNTEQTTYGASSILDDATFPDGEELNFLIGGKNGTTTATAIDCDWWAVYAEA